MLNDYLVRYRISDTTVKKVSMPVREHTPLDALNAVITNICCQERKNSVVTRFVERIDDNALCFTQGINSQLVYERAYTNFSVYARDSDNDYYVQVL